MFTTDEERQKSNDPNIHHFSKRRLRIFSSFIGCTIAVLVLLVPSYLIVSLTINRPLTLLLVPRFVFPFGLGVTVLTDGRTFHVFVFSLACGAILLFLVGLLR
jgi:VIT1/CCC1 family predicted Fe2+/Mn2+ transporter